MQAKLVWDKSPTPENSRNSEGAFIRAKDGRILFAYSRFNTDTYYDNAGCDIALIISSDEGETWDEPRIIAYAKDFGVSNLMSVSQVMQQDGSIGFYFLIKENDGSSTLGRAVSQDGVNFLAERCKCDFFKAFFVVNNDRIERLSDGRLVAPASFAFVGDENYITGFLVSEDDGASFHLLPVRLTIHDRLSGGARGMMEPGIIEFQNGDIYVWARTTMGFQYESLSRDKMQTFTPPQPSEFTSPDSPMEIVRVADDTLYTVYNPIPKYNGRVIDADWGRTPLIIRKSTDDGKTYGPCNIVEDDPNRGYCYPSIFQTNDDCLLIAYCRGSAEDGWCLARLGIRKIPLDEIQ